MHVHYLRTHIHRDTCIYTQNTYISHIDTYTHISIHTPTCEHMHINADTYRYTKTHTYMHTHICTHTRSQQRRMKIRGLRIIRTLNLFIKE